MARTSASARASGVRSRSRPGSDPCALIAAALNAANAKALGAAAHAIFPLALEPQVHAELEGARHAGEVPVPEVERQRRIFAEVGLEYLRVVLPIGGVE